MINRSEHEEQRTLFEWASIRAINDPTIELMYAIPNGGHRHKAVAAKMRAEGVKPGMPDVCLPVARRGFNAMYIELKRIGGRATPLQLRVHEQLRDQNNYVVICYGYKQAVEKIDWYLGQ